MQLIPHRQEFPYRPHLAVGAVLAYSVLVGVWPGLTLSDRLLGAFLPTMLVAICFGVGLAFFSILGRLRGNIASRLVPRFYLIIFYLGIVGVIFGFGLLLIAPPANILADAEARDTLGQGCGSIGIAAAALAAFRRYCVEI